MSRVKVAVDALIDLGGAGRAGAAVVLAELLAAEPELFATALQLNPDAFREALIRAVYGKDGLPVRATTQIATRWLSTRAGEWFRADVLRSRPVGFVTEEEGGRFRAFLTVYQSERTVGLFDTPEEAQAAVDRALTVGAQGLNWHLLDGEAA